MYTLEENYQDTLDKIEELQDRIDKAIELLDSYKLGKYDYALTPAGLLELEDILRGKDDERNRNKRYSYVGRN